MVEARHGCGARTRVTIPAVVPARAVRRVRCSGCGERYEADQVTEVRRLGSLPSFDPSSRGWQLASGLIAAALVVGVLALIQGGDDADERTRAPVAPAGENDPPAAGPVIPRPAGGDASGAKVVRGARYSLALPRGWEKIDPPAGATFAAAVAGKAEATLWIEEDPGLSMRGFVDQSLRQLQALAPDPRVVSRVPGPTQETTVVRLAAETPPEQPRYEVVLRAAGPYRYYLALTTYPEAGTRITEGITLLANSLTPEVSG